MKLFIEDSAKAIIDEMVEAHQQVFTVDINEYTSGADALYLQSLLHYAASKGIIVMFVPKWR